LLIFFNLLTIKDVIVPLYPIFKLILRKMWHVLS
jgi:hypothetical protein